MGGSRRKHKRSRSNNKVRVGLPKKNPHLFKPAFSIPPKLRSIVDLSKTKWDDQGSVLENYKSFGVVSNPNLLGVRSRTSKIIETQSLQLPIPVSPIDDEFYPIDVDDSGSELEEDDLKSALGKKRLDGTNAPLQPLTATQRLHIRPLVEKYGDNYQSMFMDTKLNKLQHSVATLEKLCKRYHIYKDKNPMLVPPFESLVTWSSIYPEVAFYIKICT